jgi:ribosomal protein S18 acetylase RimI-like enzyme
VARPLLRALERRAAELGAAAGHDEIELSKGCNVTDHLGREVLWHAGYTVTTTYHRMRIDLGPDVAPPVLRPGVEIRRTDGSEEFRRTVHAIREVAFAHHHGSVSLPYDGWVRMHDARSSTDWSQLWLASVDGEPAAALLGGNLLVPDQNAGFVYTLGTLPAHRGRGLGRALLRTYFGYAAGRGLEAVMLGVDAAGATGALGLYLSVGMRRVQAVDAWERRLPTR